MTYSMQFPNVIEKREYFLGTNGLNHRFSSRQEAVSALELSLEGATLL
jgi:hypothetical protein